MANVFYSTFLNVFLFLPRFLRFLTFFKIFIGTFFTSMIHAGRVHSKFRVFKHSNSRVQKNRQQNATDVANASIEAVSISAF